MVLTTIISGITVTALWEGVKYVYPEISKQVKSRREARKIIDENIDPLLKAADELMSKIYSLSKSDFKDLENLYKQRGNAAESEILYTIYLFGAFFGRLSILRNKSSFINLSSFTKGKKLLKFIYAFESRKNIIVPKNVQRTIGDCFLQKSGSEYEVISIFEFIQKITEGNNILINAIKPLEDALILTKEKVFRQRIYLFGILLQAFIDYFDNKHLIVRKRKIYVTKLSVKTKRDLRFRVFDEYLPFIVNSFQYYQDR